MILQNERRLFMDLDGVMVDFRRRVAEWLRIPYPTSTEFHFEWGCKEANITVPQFVAMICEETFWLDMHIYPWATNIFNWMQEHFAGRWAFLTASVCSPDCAYDKTKLVMDNFSLRPPPLIITFGKKEAVCRPGDILVDDYQKNRDAWVAAGGIVYPWRDLTADHPDAWTQVVRMQEFVETAMQLKFN